MRNSGVFHFNHNRNISGKVVYKLQYKVNVYLYIDFIVIFALIIFFYREKHFWNDESPIFGGFLM